MTSGASLYPAVARYGDMDMEPFDAYFARWPKALDSIPEPVVRDWIYRHWHCFADRWIALEPHTWRFELAEFTNADILSIDHVGHWIEDFDAEGVEFVNDYPRAQGAVGLFMLAHGTFPTPIIVACNAGQLEYPRSGGQRMKSPLQLIEGHTRLACLRGMIHARHPSIRDSHAVWLAHVPRGAKRMASHPVTGLG
ncbi:MAG TPA: hypothetical protein VFH59_06440 [Frateuria sp.]|uniref:hypothetical protein n=1 Tax=Frateuria sp. TaxID=2211372 RepID=UPI002D80E818|nr:hypothetical protein [Frateuria sp.]HET6805069.1 hypothetical protein [Frateuria sp.]